MYDRPKGNYSFLIAFTKQLHDALSSHRDDDVGNYVESLASSLAVLLALVGDEPGERDSGDDDGDEADDSSGDERQLGSAVDLFAAAAGPAADMGITRGRRSVGNGNAKRGVDLDSGVQLPPVLTRPKVRRAKGARRGKK